jgi:SAM-dependent methyltransferase
MDTKEFYDNKYSDFKAIPGFQLEQSYCLRIIQWLKRTKNWPVKGENSYLDAGCGFGLKTAIFSQEFDHSTGIDNVERVIAICQLLNSSNEKLNFLQKDIEDTSLGRYDFISAFGISYFNTNDIELLTERIVKTSRRLINDSGYMLIGTRSDLSGRSLSGWYYPTRKDLKEMKRQLKLKLSGYRIIITRPDHSISYLLSGSLLKMLGSLRKVILNKPRDLFIIINNEQGKAT